MHPQGLAEIFEQATKQLEVAWAAASQDSCRQPNTPIETMGGGGATDRACPTRAADHVMEFPIISF